jgi:hypothetical protein
VSRPDPVSQVRQPEAVVFSSVDLTVALPADGHLLPVLESHQTQFGSVLHFRSALCPAPLRLAPVGSEEARSVALTLASVRRSAPGGGHIVIMMGTVL